MKRVFDFTVALIGAILLLPLFLILTIAVAISSKGGPFFLQRRVGQFGVEFELFKFRTMYNDHPGQINLTIGDCDPRITEIGYFLRKYKLDELPQLFNVIMGDMSLVGPRPEVKKYVDLYDEYQRRVLDLKPGITDMASIKYRNESDLLAQSTNPELTYIHQIMSDKIKINLESSTLSRTVTGSIKIIFLTIKAIL